MTYFDKLNYTLSNEDTRVEYELLKANASHVFSISGSGARVLPLVARHPNELSVIDVSMNQLFLCELRLAAARKLSLPEYLYFLGYRGGIFLGSPTGDDRMDLFKTLMLSDPCRDFWLKNSGLWRPHGFVYLGSWESHFIKISKIFKTVFRINIMPIFEAHTLEEQQQKIAKHWRPLIFRNFLRVVASEFVFNRFLYKGHFSGGSDRKTEALAPWQFLEAEFTRLFETTLLRKNYMMQLFFLGKVWFEEGLPLEAQPHILDAVKKSKTIIRYLNEDLVTTLAAKPFDFISLSDTISYLPDALSNSILQGLSPDSPSGTRMVIRSFLRGPKQMDETGWTRETSEEQSAYELDGTGIYKFHIYRKV